ncbi:hypothetical protein [Nocardioides daeguensis]|uniref:C2H2-type domain-containing protein n=1 Tax=Nocardioides daeguensis TaxID=908359 RepID=A0ABP6VRW5_9ACTN|nr:hypothetical protein [Nocardioides daeguensis]MBV6728532.1 hypothetical protein [Nocardioides daeguensis]MCR1773956.1 hypothetical protein [Nocardioides daeguensis]
MGFWHTGYMEFHEPTGFESTGPASPPKPPEFPCPECGLVFSSDRARRAHRFDGHATKRPTLLFRGRECGRTRLMVTSASSAADWMTADVETISVNGRELSPEDAAKYLAHVKVGVQTVAVANGPLERTFEFDFCLAEEEDLGLVDQALEKLIASRELSRNAIDAFIMRAGRGVTARRYREGLATYLYGVLAREAEEDPGRVDASGAPLYEQRYNSAVSLLSTFDRPAAEAICGLVALHYNQFDLAVRKTNSHRVSDVAARFRSLLSGGAFVTASLADRSHGSFDQALSDSVTEELVDVGAAALDGSLSSVITQVLPILSGLRPQDQFKVRLIAAEALLAAGDPEGASRHGEALRHSKETGAWYAGFRTRLQEVGR